MRLLVLEVMLPNPPEWRDRLRLEQAEVVGNEPLSLSHLKQFPQLTYALKEAERLYPHYDWTVTPEREAIAPVRQPSKSQDSLRAHIKKLN